jgi:hypothetical protein
LQVGFQNKTILTLQQKFFETGTSQFIKPLGEERNGKLTKLARNMGDEKGNDKKL